MVYSSLLIVIMFLKRNKIIKLKTPDIFLLFRGVRICYFKSFLEVLNKKKKVRINFEDVLNFIKILKIFNVTANICPIGALISRPLLFSSRVWCFSKHYSFNALDCICSSIVVYTLSNNIFKIKPNLNLNVKYITDSVRFFFKEFRFKRILKPFFKRRDKILSINFSAITTVLLFLINRYDSCIFKFILNESNDCADMISLYRFINYSGLKNISRISNVLEDPDISSTLGFLTKKKSSKGGTLKQVLRVKKVRFINMINAVNYSSYFRCFYGFRLFLFVGCNLEKENSSLNLLINRFCSRDFMKIYTIRSNRIASSSINIGITFKIFLNILKGKHFFCKKIKFTRISTVFLGKAFYKIINNCCLIKYLKKNLMGVRLVNIIKNNYFNFLEIFGKNGLGWRKKNKILYLNNTNKFLKNKHQILRNSFIIYQGRCLTEDALLSDLIIPSNTFFEKQNTCLDLIGEIKQSQKVVNSVLDLNLFKVLNYFFKTGFKFNNIFFYLF